MTKRILAALLATVILLTLAGCANSKSDAPAPDTTRPTVTTTAETTGTTELDTDTEHTEEKKNSTAEETKPAETTETQEPSESVTEQTETKPAETKEQTEQKTEPETKPAETVPKPTEENKPVQTKPAQTENTEPPKVTEPPAVTEPSHTTTAITELVPQSIYDSPFDIGQIRAELIAAGESMGMRHRTVYKDGTVITPDNSSWELPITANASFSGAVLKRSLYDYVSSYGEYELYGGEPITDFTIYVKEITDGYEFYFLH